MNEKQIRASKRNFAKGRIVGMIGNITNLQASKDVLTIKEQLELIKCKKILSDIINYWTPVL